jgi:hypothetical protein
MAATIPALFQNRPETRGTNAPFKVRKNIMPGAANAVRAAEILSDGLRVEGV